MPSIYPNLKYSDRKFIRTEKARIRREFSDNVKQKELIAELYKRLLPQVKVEAVKEVKMEKPKAEVKKDKKIKVK